MTKARDTLPDEVSHTCMPTVSLTPRTATDSPIFNAGPSAAARSKAVAKSTRFGQAQGLCAVEAADFSSKVVMAVCILCATGRCVQRLLCSSWRNAAVPFRSSNARVPRHLPRHHPRPTQTPSPRVSARWSRRHRHRRRRRHQHHLPTLAAQAQYTHGRLAAHALAA